MIDIIRRNNVTFLGQGGRTLVFAHGFGCSQKTWQEVADMLQDEYRLVLFDHTGSGGSDLKAYNPEKYNSLDGYAQDLLDLCYEFDLQDCIVVAHSVSCMIALLASIKDPALFSRLILIGPSPYYFNETDYRGGLERRDVDGLFEMLESNYLGWSSMITPLIMGNHDRPELAEGLAQSFCANDPAIARQFARVTFYSDHREALSLVDVPSLTLQGADDLFAPPEVGAYLNRHLPQNRLVQLEASVHCPHLIAPTEIVEAIRTYLDLPLTQAVA